MCNEPDFIFELFRDKLVDGHLPEYERKCRGCGEPVRGRRGCDEFDDTVERPCDWGNCTIAACPHCDHKVTRFGVGPAGYPDCPCDGTPVPPLRWPWTSKRFVDAYCAYHFWAFDLRTAGTWWSRLLKVLPYQLFGAYTEAQYRWARIHNPEYFERKRGSE